LFGKLREISHHRQSAAKNFTEQIFQNSRFTVYLHKKSEGMAFAIEWNGMNNRGNKKAMKTKRNQVAIIGCGHVGATSAYSLLMGGFVEELILIDRDGEKLLGEVMDLCHAVPLAQPVSIRWGNYKDAAQAEIVVIAAGVSTKRGETRLDLLRRNVSVVREITGKLMRYKFDGIILQINAL
jgi:hypothetical protein